MIGARVGLWNKDCLEGMRGLAANSVHCCVTSPPYYGLRDYGADGQVGLEESPAAYVAKLVAVFEEVRRVLRPDGTLWLNLGDTYARGRSGRDDSGRPRTGPKHAEYTYGAESRERPAPRGYKAKDLIGIPWMVAFALRDAGWHLRADNIWSKKNPMPESCKDRPSRSHEYVFLLSKRARYYYDHFAVRQPAAPSALSRAMYAYRHAFKGQFQGSPVDGRHQDGKVVEAGGMGGDDHRSCWTVWHLSSKSYRGAHFATMPPTLAARCIKAGSSAHGCCPECGAPWSRIVRKERVATRPGTNSKVAGAIERGEAPYHGRADVAAVGNRDPQRHVTKMIHAGWKAGCKCGEALEPVPCTALDPFAGSGTTLAVALSLGRSAYGFELNPDYVGLAWERIDAERAKTPLFPVEKVA